MTRTDTMGSPRLMQSEAYLRFAQAIKVSDYAHAKAVAERMQRGEDSEWAFWTAQLGYVSFLNEGDDIAQYEQAPAYFDALVTQCPNDINGRFWKAYLDHILLGKLDLPYEELRDLLRHDPSHPYAALVMSGMTRSLEEKIFLLHVALSVIPNNTRALWDLGCVFANSGREEEMSQIHKTLRNIEPFVETRFGIMNGYMNEVLTGASMAENWKAEISG